ncbi:unnamed protein product [Schistosoma curassoni]|uniref:Uncharacterized protein n=1 Tax=Schistosoma curassoni TaxID=6186 RepID=A0A183L4I4_9TREM|nr:unnamed protein product [Schistosoma curassoni]
MEKAAAIGISRQLFRLVKETGIRNPTVSETISEKDGHIIHSQSRRFDWIDGQNTLGISSTGLQPHFGFPRSPVDLNGKLM